MKRNCEAMTRQTVVLLFGMLLGFALPVVHATADEAENLGVRVGFDGVYKVGVWTPVEIRNRGTDEVRVVVPDGDGISSRVVQQDDGDSSLLYVRFGRVDSQMTVEVDGRRRVFSSKADIDPDEFGSHYRPAIAASRQLIVGVVPDPIGLEDAIGLSGQDAAERPVVVRLTDCSQLPDEWYGYEGVDTLVLSTTRAEVFAGLKPDDARIEAIDRWIRRGGKLILCVGSRAESVLTEGAPLARFAPGKLSEMVPLRDTQMGALESYVLSSLPVPRVQNPSRVPRLVDVEGIVEVQEADDMPLVIRAPRGFGQIIFVAVDLDREPLSKWADRPKLLAQLLTPPTTVSDDAPQSSAVMQPGYRDMAGHLRSAMDRYDGVRMMPFWGVAVLVIVYLLLIGPCDYFFLRRTRRMRWTWVTFPLLVLAFCLGACGLDYFLKGERVRVNQIDLIDVDTESRFVRGTSWISMFSPKTETYDLTFFPETPVLKRTDTPGTHVLLSWFGLPGDALGGMNPRATNPVDFGQSYDLLPQSGRILDMPIPVRSTKSLTARWDATAAACIEADLTTQQKALVGTVTNQMEFPLIDCLLAVDRWVYQLGSIGPRESAKLDLMVRRSELKTLLTGQHVVTDPKKHTYQQRETPYDTSSIDASYILQKMMFFEAAGGRRHTGLTNGYQHFVDMSELLKTGRAILIAAVPDDHRAAELLRDGRPLDEKSKDRVTFYRFVLPVKRAE